MSETIETAISANGAEYICIPQPEPTPISVSVGDELQEKRFLPKSTLQWSMMKMMERGANQGTLIDYTHAEEETARSLELFYKITTSNCIQNETEKSETEPAVSVSVGGELQEKPYLPKSTTRWAFKKMVEANNPYGGTLIQKSSTEEERAWTESFIKELGFISTEDPEPTSLSESDGGELHETPQPEPTPLSVSVGDEKERPNMSENINDLCGTINGRPIAGYHRVKYGETQEYLESLAEAGYILMYSEDNPKEEGKLTVAKPNVMPEYLKDYATNVVYDEYGNFISCSVEGLITLAEDGTVAQTTADINNTADTTDPNNWADGPSYPVNPETKDRINGEDIVVTIIDYHHGRMLGDMDPPGRESTPPDVTTIEDLTPEDIVLIPVSNDFLQKLEEAKSIRQRLAERSKPVAFVSTLDAETEAVTSVQVACADTDGWRTIGTLNNPDGINWKWYVGNLTGSGAASVVWHAQELGALGVWTDGTDNWTGIAGWFDENWTMLGCGDFDGDGKDSVLMSLNGGLFYSVDLDGTLTSLGDLNWSGWEFGAIGDFAGDGKDDVVLFNKGLNCVVLLADGNADDYTALGQLDGSDWNIAGAGDFDGDGIDDLLVRQDSTGLIGGYAGADMSKWSVVDTTGEYYLA